MTTQTCTVLDVSINVWTLQATVASRFLGSLYRSMNDGAQAAAATRAGQPAAERMDRWRIQADLPALLAAFKWEHPDETEAEESAWLGLITSLGGISVFLATVEDRPGQSLCGLRSANARALETALRGYRASFPDDLACQGTLRALRDTAAQCARVFVDEQVDPLLRATRIQECEQTILEGLKAGLGSYL